MIYIILAILILVLDQMSKKFFDKNYKEFEVKEIIKNKLYFTNVKNYGALYGFLNDRPFLLKFISFFLIIYITYFFFKIVFTQTSILLKIAISLVTAGAYGNILDRFLKNYVTDFMFTKIRTKNTIIFNIADISIVIGSILYLHKKILQIIGN